MASSEAAGQSFNIAYGGRDYLIDIYRGLCKALGKDIEPIFGPDRPGYDPEWSFERGIEAAIDWYKENL